MTALWIAVNARLQDDPDVIAVAMELFPKQPAWLAVRATCGLLTSLWGTAIDEQEDGDVSARNDAVLEAWAGWGGKRGAFGRLFRSTFTVDGKIKEWEEYQGALLKRREADRNRKRNQRSGGKSGGRPADSPGEVRRVSGSNSNSDRDILSAPNGAEREYPAPDNAPAPEGARDADANGGNYLDTPSAREALNRRGVRDEQIDKVPTGTLAQATADIEFRQTQYDAELEAGFRAFKERYPEATMAIGAECRKDLGLPDQDSRAELSDMQLLRLRAAVVETIRQRQHWPTFNAWDGNQFPPIPDEP